MTTKSAQKPASEEADIHALSNLCREIETQIHLASVNAKEAWKKLEPEIRHVKESAVRAEGSGRDFVKDLMKRAKDLRASLKK